MVSKRPNQSTHFAIGVGLVRIHIVVGSLTTAGSLSVFARISRAETRRYISEILVLLLELSELCRNMNIIVTLKRSSNMKGREIFKCLDLVRLSGNYSTTIEVMVLERRYGPRRLRDFDDDDDDDDDDIVQRRHARMIHSIEQ